MTEARTASALAVATPSPGWKAEPAVVLARGLEVRYGSGRGAVHALRGIDLAIRQGELVAVVGSSGCGKSTLLHVLGGLLTPTAGRVCVDGQELTGMSDAGRTELRRRKLGFVFQRFNLLPTLGVWDNLELAAWVRGVAVTRERMRERLELLGLGDRLSSKPRELSGGEQQRVAIARALVGEPLLLLADEPTGSLDSCHARRVLEILEELNRRLGQTMVLITHDPEVAGHASRIVRMRDGRIDGDG